MKNLLVRPQQHLLATTQASREPERKVQNLSEKPRYTAQDLMGLSWILFEEDY